MNGTHHYDTVEGSTVMVNRAIKTRQDEDEGPNVTVHLEPPSEFRTKNLRKFPPALSEWISRYHIHYNAHNNNICL